MWKILFPFILIAIEASYAAELTCSFAVGFCSFEHITNVTAPNEAIVVTGQPTTFTDPMVYSISFQSMGPQPNQFDYFPTEIFKIFPNLTTVSMEDNLLPYLVTDAFNYCALLTSISARKLKFTHLPAAFARNCASVTYLRFTDGDLATLDANALQGLTSLTFMTLEHNKIICLPIGFFLPVKSNLEQAELGDNRIQAIDVDIIKGMSRLRSALLYINNISYIPNLNTTGTGAGILSLGLTDNPVTAIHPNMISTYFASRPTAVAPAAYTLGFGIGMMNYTACFPSAMQMLDKNNWNTTYSTTYDTCYANWPQYESRTFSCPPANSQTTTTTTTTTTQAPGSCASDKICRYYLDYADRYTCVLDGVDGTLTSISGSHSSPLLTDANVTRVYIKNSFLSRVPSALFAKFPSLEFLSVANCSLGMITGATIPVCGNLVYLDARYNDIFHISSNAFVKCTKLQTIDLTGNPIDALDSDIYVQDPSLKKVILNGSN